MRKETLLMLENMAIGFIIGVIIMWLFHIKTVEDMQNEVVQNECAVWGTTGHLIYKEKE